MKGGTPGCWPHGHRKTKSRSLGPQRRDDSSLLSKERLTKFVRCWATGCEKEKRMSKVRVLVGTHKGGFVLTSDGKREKWDVSGPFFGGWEVYHMKGSPADPNRIYASQTSGWFGQIIQRSDDGGKTWTQPGTPPGEQNPQQGPQKGESNKFVYNTAPEKGGKPLTTHQWYDGTQHPWEFKRVWHIEPSLTEADTVYAGVEDAAIFKSTNGGKSWEELPGLRGHGTGPKWQPGAGGMCLHTIVLDAKDPKRMYVAISAAGAFRTDDGGKNWKPINRGLRSQYIPDPTAEIGHCVHRIAAHKSRPNVLFMQKHWDVMRSDDAGDNWHEVSGNLPTDFGFVIDVHAHEPETIYVIPIKSDGEHFPPDGKLRVYRSKTGGNEWEALGKGLPDKDCYVNILRDAMAVDSLDKCGIYFGTTGGQVYASRDAGDNWAPIVRDLPAVLSVEVQTLP
jgi:photosystem II stability/assembly factor-like uncharacterized protein